MDFNLYCARYEVWTLSRSLLWLFFLSASWRRLSRSYAVQVHACWLKENRAIVSKEKDGTTHDKKKRTQISPLYQSRRSLLASRWVSMTTNKTRFIFLDEESCHWAMTCESLHYYSLHSKYCYFAKRQRMWLKTKGAWYDWIEFSGTHLPAYEVGSPT